MKSRLYLLIRSLSIALLLIISLMSWGNRYAYAEMMDGIVAVVDDTIIMMSDLKKKAVSMGVDPENYSQAGHVLNMMIEDIIVKKTYQAFALPPIDPENVRSVMADTGLEFEDALCFIMRQTLMKIMVKSRVVVTHNMIMNYYDTHPEYSGRASVRLKQILIRPGGDKLQRVDSAMAELRNDNTFDDVARKYSDILISGSCDLGWIATCDLAHEIKQAIADAKIGSIVGPVETKEGIFIFKVLDKGVRGNRDLDEVKDEINHTLERQFQQEAFRYWLDKIMGEHFIGIYL